MTRRVAIWGDSILKGVIYDSDAKRYKTLPEKNIGPDYHILNFSRFGTTAPKALEKMKQQLYDTHDFDVALIEFGGNDCAFDWAKVSDDPIQDHSPNTDLGVYKETIKEMIALCRAYKIEPIVVNLPPIDPYKYFAWVTKDGLNSKHILSFLGDIKQIYYHQERYNLALMEISALEGVDLINIRDMFLSQRKYTSLLCEDGMHITKEGQDQMLKVFSAYAQSRK